MAKLTRYYLQSASFENATLAELVLCHAVSFCAAFESMVIGQCLCTGEALKTAGHAHRGRLALRNGAIARNNAIRADTVLSQVTVRLVIAASTADFLACTTLDEHIAPALHNFVLYRLQGLAPLVSQHYLCALMKSKRGDRHKSAQRRFAFLSLSVDPRKLCRKLAVCWD